MENIRLLIVDDNPVDRNRIIDEIGSLNHYSYQVFEACTLDEALPIVSNSDIKLLFLNLHLKDSKGIETFKEFETRFPFVAKIILTEESNETFRNELLNEGAQEFLIKNNFNKDELFKTINYAIERNKTRNALIESNNFFQSTLDSLVDSVAILDEKGTILYVNKSWREFAKQNNAQLVDYGIGTNYLEVSVFSDDKEKKGPTVAAAIIDIIEGRKEKFHIEYSCDSPKEDRWFSLNLTYFDQHGKRKIVATHKNITEQKENEKALSTSDRIFKHSLDMICIAGFDGFFKVLNPACTKILGWSESELLSKPWLEFVHPDDRKRTKNITSKTIEGTEVIQFENRYICKNGDIKWLSWNSFPYQEENIAFAVARDVTENKMKEELLKTTNQAISQSPVSIVVTDRKGNIEYVNPKFTELSGYGFKEVIGKNPRILKAEENVTTNFEELWETICSGKEWTGEFHNKKKNGELYWEEAKISPVKDENGNIIKFVSVKEDITKRKQIEIELVKSKKDAEKSDRLKSEFLTQISHEIRTPVNTLLNFTSLVEADLHDKINEEMAECFNHINGSGKRIVRTIDLLIKISELYSDTYETEFKENDITNLLSEIISTHKSAAALKGIKLNFITAVEEIKCIYDENSMRDVFSNLIDNAIKFTHSGEVKVVVQKTILGKTLVTIQDTGEGISRKYINNLYTPFSQETNGYSRKYDGNGLGLTLVKKYCELNNAGIYVSSEKGVGSSFTITLT